MLLDKRLTYILFSLCLISIYILFNIKDRVTAAKTELGKVQTQIQHELDTIHILKAEFVYLSSPERLKTLNERYLKLHDTQLSQMVNDPLHDTLIQQKVIKKRVAHVRWNYKYGPKKYLASVGGRE